MLKLLDKFEKGIVASLVFIMVIVVVLATVDLAWNIVLDVISPPIALLNVSELLDIFGYVLLVIIGLELLETIRIYLKEGVIQIRVVIEVALIAIARKVIILDYKKTDSMTLIGMAALILALSVAFFGIHRFIQKKKSDA